MNGYERTTYPIPLRDEHERQLFKLYREMKHNFQMPPDARTAIIARAAFREALDQMEDQKRDPKYAKKFSKAYEYDAWLSNLDSAQRHKSEQLKQIEAYLFEQGSGVEMRQIKAVEKLKELKVMAFEVFNDTDSDKAFSLYHQIGKVLLFLEQNIE